MSTEDEKSGQNFFTKLMSMNDTTWERHANPLSVWTRVITGLPVILLAVWSIRPLGWWSLLVICAAFFWIWLNPRLFKPPVSTDNWASKVTFGERVWLDRKITAIPRHHANWASFLSTVAGVGFIIALLGAFFNSLLPTLLGGVISWFGKMWFCDRMVWLYQDMKNSDPEYSRWLR